MFFFYSKDGGIPPWIFIVVGLIGTIYFINMIIRQNEEKKSQNPVSYSSDYFLLALLHFSVRIIKADREKLLDYKLNFIEDYLLPLIGIKETHKRICEIRDAEIKDINIYTKRGGEFHYQANIDEKLTMMDFLITLAAIVGKISNSEMATLRLIVDEIGISKRYFDFEIFESEYYNTLFEDTNTYSSEKIHSEYNISDDYKMFEIDSSATNLEVKKAYHDQIAKHHPDKVSHLGEHLKKFANEYCAKLNEAYERIKKERGMI